MQLVTRRNRLGALLAEQGSAALRATDNGDASARWTGGQRADALMLARPASVSGDFGGIASSAGFGDRLSGSRRLLWDVAGQQLHKF
ncbi:hypothetical protein [Streptomyces sp. NBC_01361]|uniref:hypothetical protein n=1 Tax=Streptomyces sp. NBC_01361 TaxID=2903838 RepID=UPI002E30A9CD|nr:hypothetical protein [Streptomyces sp. NBC_01361]